MLNKSRPFKIALLAGAATIAVSCGQSNGPAASDEGTSNTLVTDVAHTDVKRQSIGNCWIYAQATWLESLLLSHQGETRNVSESYWTWFHWYEQIVGRNITEIQTGGWWSTSANIVRKYGFVMEGEFIEGEANAQMSAKQASALAYMNAQLQPGGALGTLQQRSAANVRKELDKAYGTNMAAAQQLARSANTTLVGPNQTLAQALNGWTYASFPRVYGQNAPVSLAVRNQRNALLKRVMRALNDKKPVVMSFMVDFNAMDANDLGTFKKSLLDVNGMGSQGGHMVVLEDYTVKNVPGVGSIGEGDVSPELKAKALQGELVTLKAKNSWGTNRPERGLTDGYTRFEMPYLLSSLQWKQGDSGATSWYTTLTDFVLPPGY